MRNQLFQFQSPHLDVDSRSVEVHFSCFPHVSILALVPSSFCRLYFVIFWRGRLCDLLLRVTADEPNWSCSAAGVVGVNTSTPLHLRVWLHCGLLSSSCSLTGSGGWGLVPATGCDMLTKRAGTRRFWEIHRKKENVEGKKKVVFFLYSRERRRQTRPLSAALCWRRKGSRFPPLYLMDRPTVSQQPPPPSVAGQINGVGPTRPQATPFKHQDCEVLSQSGV